MKTGNLLTRLTVVIILFVALSSGKIPDVKKNYVKFDKNILVSKYEITNKEYREFLQDLKATDQKDKYVKCLYDSTQWIKKFPWAYNEPMVKMYHWHAAYDNYPIVNITKESADSYCEWLTQKYNASPKKEYKKVLFRLPTEAEWVKLANSTSPGNLPWSGNSLYADDEKTALANIKIKDINNGTDNYKFDGSLMTSIVGHFKANKIGVFDIAGNVSELTQTGVLKGGSWDSYLEDCTTDKDQNYDLPDPRVGFRVIMEVVEE
jgi:formylglycine-generating enzyme required for sulfatase activity